MENQKMINKLNGMIATNNDDLTKIVVLEGIDLINKGTNRDKVFNWVNNILSYYQDKPQPLTEKEIAKNLERIKNKKDKKAAKELALTTLIGRLNTIIDSFEIKLFAFFDYKSDIEFIISRLTPKYELLDRGDGAYELIVSKIKIDQQTLNEIRSIENELNEFNDFYETQCNTEMIFNDQQKLTDFLLKS